MHGERQVEMLRFSLLIKPTCNFCRLSWTNWPSLTSSTSVFSTLTWSWRSRNAVTLCGLLSVSRRGTAPRSTTISLFSNVRASHYLIWNFHPHPFIYKCCIFWIISIISDDVCLSWSPAFRQQLSENEHVYSLPWRESSSLVLGSVKVLNTLMLFDPKYHINHAIRFVVVAVSNLLNVWPDENLLSDILVLVRNRFFFIFYWKSTDTTVGFYFVLYRCAKSL